MIPLLGQLPAPPVEIVASRLKLPYGKIAELVRVRDRDRPHLTEESAYRVEIRILEPTGSVRGLFADADGACTGKLLLGDFQNNRTKSLVAVLAFPSNDGGSPHALHLLSIGKEAIREVGRLQSNQDIEIRRTASGVNVFLDSHEMFTRAISHADSPRWRDALAWKNGKFQVVRHGLESIYRHCARDLWNTLKSAPREKSLWYYYGVAAERAGMKVSPRYAYAQIEAIWLRNNEAPPEGNMEPLSAWRKRNRWPETVGYFSCSEVTPLRPLKP